MARGGRWRPTGGDRSTVGVVDGFPTETDDTAPTAHHALDAPRPDELAGTDETRAAPRPDDTTAHGGIAAADLGALLDDVEWALQCSQSDPDQPCTRCADAIADGSITDRPALLACANVRPATQTPAT